MTIFTATIASAIAKLDLASLSHAQRLQAIARAAGYASYEAIPKKGAPSKAPAKTTTTPIMAIVGYGESMVRAYYDQEPLAGQDGDIAVHEFSSPEALAAYQQGLSDGNGWGAAGVLVSTHDHPEHPYWSAAQADPALSFESWHDDHDDADSKDVDIVFPHDLLAFEEDMDARDTALCLRTKGRAAMRIVGYQVEDADGNHWNHRYSFEILPPAVAIADLREAIAEGQAAWRITCIREDDIEEPTFV